jgi:RND family efflux transporter MFP subunit
VRRDRVGLLVLLAVGAVACGGGASAPELEFRASVTTAAVTKGDVERLVRTTGTVRAEREAKVVVETGGRLQMAQAPGAGRRWAVGDAVARGQLIAVVAADEVEVTARLQARRQALEAAEAEFERQQDLHDQGLSTRLAFEQAQTTLQNARADYRQGLQQSGRSRLVAPIDGVLSKVTTAADGEILATATLVAEVMDFRSVLVDLDLGASEVADIRPDQAVRLRESPTAKPLPATVLRVAPAIDPTSRTFRVEVGAGNVEGRLRPGLFVKAEVVLETHRDVVVAPTRAVVSRDGKWIVFVVDGPTAQLREVEVGLVQEDVAEVTRGLQAGERVVTTGQDTLKDRARVIVRS